MSECTCLATEATRWDRMLLVMRTAIVAVALVLAGASAYAQSSGVSAIYHGDLVIKPSFGRLDRDTGNAELKVGPWPFKLYDGSNGIFPDQEAILIEIGEDPGFFLPAGSLRAVHTSNRIVRVCPPPVRRGESPPCHDVVVQRPNPSGTPTYVYRAKAKTAGPRAVTYFRLTPQADGTYLVRFKLRGLDLSRLLVEDPVCTPFAVIIGDDDGFSGVAITSPSFRSPRVAIPSNCDIGDDWPWIRD